MSSYMRDLREKVGSRLLLMPSAAVAIRDERGRVLLARHRTGDIWAFPGGSLDPLETPADAAVRETWEELGVSVELRGLVGVYAGSEFVVRYENGDRTAYVSVVFDARCTAGEPRPDGDEVLEVRWCGPADAAALPLPPWMDEALRDVFAGAVGAFRRPTWTPDG